MEDHLKSTLSRNCTWRTRNEQTTGACRKIRVFRFVASCRPNENGLLGKPILEITWREQSFTRIYALAADPNCKMTTMNTQINSNTQSECIFQTILYACNRTHGTAGNLLSLFIRIPLAIFFTLMALAQWTEVAKKVISIMRTAEEAKNGNHE